MSFDRNEKPDSKDAELFLKSLEKSRTTVHDCRIKLLHSENEIKRLKHILKSHKINYMNGDLLK